MQQHSWRSATKISLIFFIFRKKLFFSPLTRWLTLFLELASWLLALAYHSHVICILNNVVGAIGWYTAVGQPIKEMWAELLFTLLWGPSVQYDAGYFQPAHLWTSREKVQCRDVIGQYSHNMHVQLTNLQLLCDVIMSIRIKITKESFRVSFWIYVTFFVNICYNNMF